MRLFLVFVFSFCTKVLLLISTTSAAPGVTSTNKQACNKECTLDYKPICAGHSENDKDKKSFGNVCVMDKYNCERDESLLRLIHSFIHSTKSYDAYQQFFFFVSLFCRFDTTERGRMSRQQICTFAVKRKHHHGWIMRPQQFCLF